MDGYGHRGLGEGPVGQAFTELMNRAIDKPKEQEIQ
jgi:hypothetical protein